MACTEQLALVDPMSVAPARMTTDEALLRLRQQHLVAEFGVFALMRGELQRLLDEAARIASEGLQTQFAKVLQYRPVSDDLLVVAGVGWHAGVVGHSTLGSGLDSPAGYALHTGQATLSNHLAQEQRFRVPSLLAEHGVQSAINVVIDPANESPYGVLEVDSSRRHDFFAADTAFLQALANVLAAGLVRAREEQVQHALLQDKDMLMREVHHRVANSLQLVRTILGLQARGVSEEARQQLDMAAGRIQSIAAVHRRLYQGGSVIEGEVEPYLRALLDDMHDMLEESALGREIQLNVEPIMLPADNLTPLGLVVSELVTNAVKYGRGTVTVTVAQIDAGVRVIVEDEGPGFGPEFIVRERRGLGMRLITSLARGRAEDAIVVDTDVPHGRIAVTLKM